INWVKDGCFKLVDGDGNVHYTVDSSKFTDCTTDSNGQPVSKIPKQAYLQMNGPGCMAAPLQNGNYYRILIKEASSRYQSAYAGLQAFIRVADAPPSAQSGTDDNLILEIYSTFCGHRGKGAGRTQHTPLSSLSNAADFLANDYYFNRKYNDCTPTRCFPDK